LLGYIQKQRREKDRTLSDNSSFYLAGSWAPDPTAKMSLLNCLKEVGKANRRYARILNLHQIGFNRKEICAKLGINLQQSYLVMSRARAMLRQCLETGASKP
jgi:DNA-directed RNA polymerase specialized sigma24 family protein